MSQYKSMKNIVIFDMDGVIVDSEPLHTDHLQIFLTNLGVESPEKITINLKGRNARTIWGLLIDEFQLEHDIDELVTRARASYFSYLNDLPQLPPIPGAVEFIKYCHEKSYRLAIASSASPRRINMFLEKTGVKEYFEVIVSGDDVRHAKPSPDIFLLAAQKLDVEPRDCIVIEDAENGVTAAKAAGMKCIAYGGSDHNTDNLLGADLVVTDFHALIKGLKTGGLPV